MHIVHILL